MTQCNITGSNFLRPSLFELSEGRVAAMHRRIRCLGRTALASRPAGDILLIVRKKEPLERGAKVEERLVHLHVHQTHIEPQGRTMGIHCCRTFVSHRALERKSLDYSLNRSTGVGEGLRPTSGRVLFVAVETRPQESLAILSCRRVT